MLGFFLKKIWFAALQSEQSEVKFWDFHVSYLTLLLREDPMWKGQVMCKETNKQIKSKLHQHASTEKKDENKREVGR